MHMHVTIIVKEETMNLGGEQGRSLRRRKDRVDVVFMYVVFMYEALKMKKFKDTQRKKKGERQCLSKLNNSDIKTKCRYVYWRLGRNL